MVFSSKARSPYTQMYLTHLDAEGHDSPPVLVENSTAANRAVNLPEFLNIPANGLLGIDMPAAEFYTRFDRALELAANGQLDTALAEWDRALAIDPANAKAHNNRGVLLSRIGRAGLAMAEFRKAIELKPDYADARYNLGGALAAAGKPAEALAEWRRAAALAPGDPDIQNRLGLAYAGANRLEEAIGHWQRAIELRPRFPEVRYGLGRAYYLAGRMSEAVAQWRELLRDTPDDLAVLNRMARVLGTCPDASVRNGADAVRFAEHAIELSRTAEVLDTLAAAYAEAGRFPEASRTAESAAQLAPRDRGIRERLESYRAGRPYRER
jgi:tetratricopeptide (TPR) repeat protein